MFQIGGLASGLDTGTMIEQLMLLERKPLTVLQNRKTEISRADSAFQAINTRLSALKSKLSDLRLAKNLTGKKAVSSAEGALTATAGSGAADGAYRIKINQLATATKAGSSTTLATAATAGLKLSEIKTGSGTAVTTGAFTLGNATITLKSSDVTLQELVDAINASGPVDNAKLSVSGPTGLGSSAASLIDGRIQLNVSANSAVAIGSGADTSNVLQVIGLKSPTIAHLDPIAKDGMLRVGSRLNVAGVGAALSDANLSTSISGDGAFKINGVEIAYQTTDSINDVLSHINASSAGVLASYNSIEDRIVLTSKKTGNSAIGLEDVTGNFLAATKLLGSAQETGKNASIVVDGVNGGNPVESATNEFKDIVPGLSFSAKEVKSDWVTLTVSSDSQASIDTVKAFINEFNATVDAIAATRGKGQILQGDSALSDIYNKLYRMVYEPVGGLTGYPSTLSAIGIGTTKEDRKHLSLDETKFKEALANNPERVLELFSAKAENGNSGGVAVRLNQYLTELGGEKGVFAARKDSATRQAEYIDDQIEAFEIRLDLRRKKLVNQFTAMEKAVAMMKSQQNAMMSQLSSLQRS